jgi:hypothetical protein
MYTVKVAVKEDGSLVGDLEDSVGHSYFVIDNDQKNEMCKKLLEYFHFNGTSGEQIQQGDNSVIDALDLLTDICDNVIEFKQVEK